MRARFLVIFVVIAAAWALAVAPALAGDRLEQAREESGVTVSPRSSYDLPAGVLRLSASELLASAQQHLVLSLTLDRAVAGGELALTLPARWVGRSAVSDLPYARLPVAGREASGGAGVTRSSAQVVRLRFGRASAGDMASIEVADEGIPAGTYELPYRWTERGRTGAAGTAHVSFYAPVREGAEEEGDSQERDWTYLLRDTNVINDASDESETFLSVVPGNRLRYIVGANFGGGFNAWITNNGGASFTKAPVSPSADVPGSPGFDSLNLCCDPMAAADAAGNLWYGGLASGSRIVVTRAAPGATAFGTTVGLPARTSGTQDKPMMTIDNSPASPRFGRLYVVWSEPSTGTNVVISQCDTRPGGSPNAANCDNADNWSTPVSVTPSTGSYIYADVAVASDGKVYVVWWDYSANNAIRGDVCDPNSQNCASAGGWGTPQTIAELDHSIGGPIPFDCPIVAQPGGRAGPAPQLDVDRSGGPDNGRVYVTWSDLRAGSGTTRCNNPPSPPNTDSKPPASTHLTWDSFVASAAGALPGGGDPSPLVGTRLLTDGEDGGQANSDDWFAWLAVDQTTGQAWADFYSTRDDATRRTTNFYVRSVTPGGSGHALGILHRVSTAPSDYSTQTCCKFGNDYGDYVGIDATQGAAIATWTDHRSGQDGEAYTDTVQGAFLVGGAETLDDSPAAGGDGDGLLEPGESFRLTKPIRNVGVATATAVTSNLTASQTGLALTQSASNYPDVAVGETQSNVTPFAGSLAANAPCGSPLAMSLQVATPIASAVVPVSVPTGCKPATPPAPPPAPQPPPPPPPDTSLEFELTGSASQRPLRNNVGIVVRLSCPRESCRVTVKGKLTIPAATKGGKARRTFLKSRSAVLAKGRTSRLAFKLSASLRRQVLRALRTRSIRSRIRVLITATASDAASNKRTRTLTIKVRR